MCIRPRLTYFGANWWKLPKYLPLVMIFSFLFQSDGPPTKPQSNEVSFWTDFNDLTQSLAEMHPGGVVVTCLCVSVWLVLIGGKRWQRIGVEGEVKIFVSVKYRKYQLLVAVGLAMLAGKGFGDLLAMKHRKGVSAYFTAGVGVKKSPPNCETAQLWMPQYEIIEIRLLIIVFCSAWCIWTRERATEAV